MKKLSLLKKWDNLSPYRKLIFGFLIAIFIGVILLKMPFSLRENQNISVLDSLFTIVSAICVTGLSVVDVSQVFTSTGQLIILFFIQLGGLGVMTVSIIVFLLVGKKMSFETRELLKEERNSNSNGGITNFIKQLLLTVFIIEISGALILTYGFSKYYSLKRYPLSSRACPFGYGSSGPAYILILYQTAFFGHLVLIALMLGGQ